MSEVDWKHLAILAGDEVARLNDEIATLKAALGNAIERAEQAEAQNARMMAMLGGDMGLKQLRAAEQRAEEAEAEVARLNSVLDHYL